MSGGRGAMNLGRLYNLTRHDKQLQPIPISNQPAKDVAVDGHLFLHCTFESPFISFGSREKGVVSCRDPI